MRLGCDFEEGLEVEARFELISEDTPLLPSRSVVVRSVLFCAGGHEIPLDCSDCLFVGVQSLSMFVDHGFPVVGRTAAG